MTQVDLTEVFAMVGRLTFQKNDLEKKNGQLIQMVQRLQAENKGLQDQLRPEEEEPKEETPTSDAEAPS